jgi:hypothetical protein
MEKTPTQAKCRYEEARANFLKLMGGIVIKVGRDTNKITKFSQEISKKGVGNPFSLLNELKRKFAIRMILRQIAECQ